MFCAGLRLVYKCHVSDAATRLLCAHFALFALHEVTCFVFFLADTLKMGWAQRKKNRVDLHREHLLAETQRQLEIEMPSGSSAVRGASPVTSDAEHDSPASLAVQDPPDSPVVHISKLPYAY